MSSDRQTVENQRYEILTFCEREKVIIDGWIDETVSGTCQYTRRRLGTLLKQVKKGDLIVCSELSRLGRNLYMIMEILSLCMKQGCRVWTIKDGYRLGDDIQSKVLAFAFGLSAEIERTLISDRTRQALARLKAEGKHVGRPTGSNSSQRALVLYKHDRFIRRALQLGWSQIDICKHLSCNRNTLRRYITRFIQPVHKPVQQEIKNDDTYSSQQDCQVAITPAL